MEITIDGTTYVCTPKQAEAPAFAVGDWVEAVSDDRGGRFKMGARGIVEKPFVSNDGFYVDWKTGTFDMRHHDYKGAWAREIRKIAPPEAPAPVRRFKVGDWVEFVSTCDTYFSPGDKGEIIYIEADASVPYSIRKTDGKTVNALHRSIKHTAQPAPATLKYAPGQVVMVPMVVDQVAPDQCDGEEYLLEALAGHHKDWYASEAIDPPVPAPGDECWFWDEDGDVPKRGKLDKVDDDDVEFPYRARLSAKTLDYDWYVHCVKCNDPD